MIDNPVRNCHFRYSSQYLKLRTKKPQEYCMWQHLLIVFTRMVASLISSKIMLQQNGKVKEIQGLFFHLKCIVYSFWNGVVCVKKGEVKGLSGLARGITVNSEGIWQRCDCFAFFRKRKNLIGRKFDLMTASVCSCQVGRDSFSALLECERLQHEGFFWMKRVKMSQIS